MRYWIAEIDGRQHQLISDDAGFVFAPFRCEDTGRMGARHETWRWSTADTPGGWESDLAGLVTHLCASIDARRDREIAALRSEVSDARRWEYEAKAREAYSATGPWPFLDAEAAAKGVTLDEVRQAVLARIEPEMSAAATIAATATAAKAAIQAATSCAAAQAIFDAITWPDTGATV